MTEQDGMMVTDDDCDHMETEKDIDLMDTADESDNDSESVRDSDMMSQKNFHFINVLRRLSNLLSFCCLQSIANVAFM